MAKNYELGENYLRDLFFNLTMTGYDLINPENKKEIENEVMNILTYVLNNEEDILYLDFDVEKGIDENDIKIVGNNLITSLWFSGVNPNDVDSIKDVNIIKFHGKTYEYDEKTKSLTIK